MGYMNNMVTRPLKAFLCHASGDKPAVREMYKRLVFEGVDAWLDKENLLPGQDWRVEIPRAVKEADVVIIFLSKNSISKEGYVQKEIKFALDIAEEKPEGAIFLIPARLEECVVPERISRWHWVDLYDENGFVKLLRSLKLRADTVGATVEPASYEDSDKEVEHKVEQLYTEGLAAFYTEEWDKAYQRFQTILNEHPNHKNAAEKMAEAEKQGSLAKLYAQAMQGYKTENWQAAIPPLEELLQRSAEYKDAVQLLRNARKQKQLKELYAEAKTLHAAQKWQAVLKVFEQLSAIEPAYPDSDGLLASAQKEVTEFKRLADLNEQYSQAVREMDSGGWVEARRLLEQIHKSQTGFLETERLLAKAENEIRKVDERQILNARVKMLYEQARGLARSKNWRRVLDKIEEIQKLDDSFIDTDELAQKARAELTREDQDTQKHILLAGVYAEAVRLLNEARYQEALEKWNEVQLVDPKHKDTARVKSIATKKLAELMRPGAQSVNTKFVFTAVGTSNSAWLLLAAFLATMILRVLWGFIEDSFYIWAPDASLLPQFLLLFGIGASYGVIVSFSLKRMIHNWGLSQSLTVIIGWGIGLCAGLQFSNMGLDFMTAALVVCSLAMGGAIKWASPATTLIKIALITACWALAWKAGGILGSYLGIVFNTNYIVYAVVDAITILFGLTATFAVYENDSSGLLKLTGLSMLGFAAGNFIATLLGEVFSSDVLTLTPVWLAVWGFIGGVIFELPSRDLRKILVKGAMCGLGFVIGYFVALLILQNVYPQFYSVLKNIIWGAGLGMCFGLGIRRASAITLLTILGSAIFVFTSAYSFISSMGTLSEAIVRGGLIGLILGLGYVYVTGEIENVNGHREMVDPQ
jgi:outer membrane protein assembly factor BamD (BamD/ComL family)